MDKKELDKILELHRKWQAGERGGCHANLCGANLRDADLYGANLRDADLCGANLRDANLYGADLCGANLRDANLYGADLTDTRMQLPDIYILKDQSPNIKLIAFKFLRESLISPYEGFPYEVGKTYSTTKYDGDERLSCSSGFNVATRQWCERNMGEGDVLVKVSFKAGDIVAIPYATDGKFRVKRMKVEEII